MILVITYDLHGPGRDYEAIYKVLRSASGGYAKHPQGSVWFIDTLEHPRQWIEALQQAGDVNDEFFAAQVMQNWASVNQDPDVTQWLESTNRRW